MLQRILYRIFCDLVKGDTVHFAVVQLQGLCQMPGNGFSFTVRVSCEIHFVRFLRRLTKGGKNVSLSSDGDIFRFIVIFHVHSQLAFGKIPHMTVGCSHLVIAA